MAAPGQPCKSTGVPYSSAILADRESPAEPSRLPSMPIGPGQPIAVYAHIHRPYIRSVSGMIVANTGSVGLPYDGDRRAAYLLLDGSEPSIRRVEYDVDREIETLSACGLPHGDWIAKVLESGRYQGP